MKAALRDQKRAEAKDLAEQLIADRRIMGDYAGTHAQGQTLAMRIAPHLASTRRRPGGTQGVAWRLSP